MGIDGKNYITIFGPSIVIDDIEHGGLILSDDELNDNKINNDELNDLKYLMEYMNNVDTNMVLKRGPILLNLSGKKTSNKLTISIRGKSDVNHYLKILVVKHTAYVQHINYQLFVFLIEKQNVDVVGLNTLDVLN